MVKRESYFNSEETREYKEWARSIVKEWHDKAKPEYIFLTETSGVPMGWLLKETWKYMYPGEEVPKFYRINPHALYAVEKDKEKDKKGHISDQKKKEEGLEEYLNKRLRKPDSTIIIYDEAPLTNIKRGRVEKIQGLTQVVSHGEKTEEGEALDRLHKDYRANVSVSRVYSMFKDKTNAKNIWIQHESPKSYLNRVGYSSWKRKNPSGIKRGLPKITTKRSVEDEFGVGLGVYTTKITGDLIKDPEKRRKAREFIKELRDMGAETGKEAREEMIKKQGLEQRLWSMLSILGIFIGLSFLSNNITGNAIADLSTSTTSWVGGVLLVVGLVAGFFWIKRKKKNPVVKKNKN